MTSGLDTAWHPPILKHLTSIYALLALLINHSCPFVTCLSTRTERRSSCTPTGPNTGTTTSPLAQAHPSRTNPQDSLDEAVAPDSNPQARTQTSSHKARGRKDTTENTQKKFCRLSGAGSLCDGRQGSTHRLPFGEVCQKTLSSAFRCSDVIQPSMRASWEARNNFQLWCALR